MTFGGQFLRQLSHWLVFFQGSFGQEVFVTRLSAVFLPRPAQPGGIHLCGDKTAIFLMPLTETAPCFEASAFTTATAR